MRTDSISRSSSTITIEVWRTPSATSSDAGTCDIKAAQKDDDIKNKDGITPHEFEAASIKQKILKFFCCA